MKIKTWSFTWTKMRTLNSNTKCTKRNYFFYIQTYLYVSCYDSPRPSFSDWELPIILKQQIQSAAFIWLIALTCMIGRQLFFQGWAWHLYSGLWWKWQTWRLFICTTNLCFSWDLARFKWKPALKLLWEVFSISANNVIIILKNNIWWMKEMYMNKLFENMHSIDNKLLSRSFSRSQTDDVYQLKTRL